MNTTEIGNQFENLVFDYLSEELKNGRFLVIPENCKIFKKKKYKSKETGKFKVIDISIESKFPDSNDFSFLIAIECKKYSKPIPIDDIQVFNSTLEEIAGKNVKGIIVSSNSLQEGALLYAQSNKIGVIRYFEDNNFKWILNRSITGLINFNNLENKKNFIKQALLDEKFKNDQIDLFCNIEDEFTNSLSQFIYLLLKDIIDDKQLEKYLKLDINENRKEDNIVKFIPKDKIELLSEDILNSINYLNDEVPIKTICNYLEKNNEVKFSFEDNLGSDSLGFDILGKIVFNPTIISIAENSHKDPNQLKFTIAHELGHYYLKHYQYLNSEFYSEKDIDDDILKFIDIEEIKRMEWQANYFASCLLLPKTIFIKEFLRILDEEDIRDRGNGLLYVDNQKCNIDNFYQITNKLKNIFQVSRKAIEIKLKNLELLNDVRQFFKNIRNIKPYDYYTKY